MKLIIECTEQTYSECKKISGLSETAFVIANGKPYDDIGKYDKAKGTWIQYSFHDFGALGDWDYKCSRCGKVNGGRSSFCPNCGADMRKGGEEK